MTARVVTYSQVECDSCGKLRNETEADATTSRIAAAKDGWRYVAFNIKGKGLQKRIPDPKREGSWKLQTVPRQWDCCPDCPMPESAEDAAKIRDERKVNTGIKWVNRDEVPST